MRYIHHGIDMTLLQSSGRIRHPTHGALSDTNMRRVPLGTPAVATINAPFSHIQIISKPSQEPIKDENSAPVVFQTPSYSQETERIMAAPSSYQASSLTASLANNTLGTTFAAKARAAELNAVRARKAAKEMETDEEDVPSTGSVALGALKFTRTRNRGKGKTLALDERREESVQGDESGSESTQAVAPPDSQSQLVQQPEPSSSNGAGRNPVHDENTPALTLESTHPTGRFIIHKVGEDKSIPQMPMAEQSSQPESHTATSQLACRGSSALTQNGHFAHIREGGVQVRATPKVCSTESLQHIQSLAKHRQPLTAMEETKLMNLGVLPPLRPAQRSVLTAKGHDDPFVEQPFTVQSDLYHQYVREQKLGQSNGIKPTLPLGSDGAFDSEFRSPSFSQAHPSQFPPFQPRGKVNGDHADSAEPQPKQYPRDPRPYTSFSNQTSFSTQKKDMLLQNLHDVVASSSRTVLYDPAARPDALASKESLKASDPLPWTDRPVDIHDITSPLAPPVHALGPTLAKSSATQTPPPGLNQVNIWNPLPQTIPVSSGRESSQPWFLKDVLNEQGPQPLGDRDTACESDGNGHSTQGENTSTTLPHNLAATQPISCLMEAVYHNLTKYLDKSNPDYFRRYARAPEWCIDNSQEGNNSYFGDWGAWGPPPPRVGRDPRYRPTFHEGRYTVFEEIGRRGGRDGPVRRFH